MTLRFLILFPLVLIGCSHPCHSDAPTSAAMLGASATEPPSRSVESFRFIGSSITMQQVRAKLGAPDQDVGSGLYVYVYRLNDGSDVLIGSPDGSRILYVRHGTTVLFEQR
jgi:hypothetical protein